MKEITRNVLVGLFVLASLSVASVLMVWFGEAPEWLGTSDWALKITGVREIRGIGQGAPVLLNGVQIGRVASLEFADPQHPGRGVVIGAKIKKQFSVPVAARAKVYGSMFGLGAGEVNINVEPGATQVLIDQKEGGVIHGEMASMIREIISEELVTTFQGTLHHVGLLAEATTPAAHNLGKMLEERSVADVGAPGTVDGGPPANLSTVVQRLDLLLAHANSVLGDEDVKGDLRGVAHDLQGAAAEIKVLVELWLRESQRISDRLTEGIEHTDDNLNKSLTRLITVLDHLDEAAQSLAAAGHQITRGEGTVGRLVYDDRLYEAGVLALTRLAEVLERVNHIAAKIEREGRFTIAQTTPLGTFPKDFPVKTEDSGEK